VLAAGTQRNYFERNQVPAPRISMLKNKLDGQLPMALSPQLLINLTYHILGKFSGCISFIVFLIYLFRPDVQAP
jgi:hypothetical protein